MLYIGLSGSLLEKLDIPIPALNKTMIIIFNAKLTTIDAPIFSY